MAELSQNPLQTQPGTEHSELRIPICKVFTAKHLTKRQKLKLHFASGARDMSPVSVNFLRAAQLPRIREHARSLHGGVPRARTPRSGQSSAPSLRGLPAPSLGSAGGGPPRQPPPAAPEPGLCPSPPSREQPRAPLTHRHRRAMAGSAGPGGSGRGAERGSGVGRCPLRPGSRRGPAPGPALPDGRCSSARGGQLGGRRGLHPLGCPGLPPGLGAGQGLVLAGRGRDAFGWGWSFHDMIWGWHGALMDAFGLGWALHVMLSDWDMLFME